MTKKTAFPPLLPQTVMIKDDIMKPLYDTEPLKTEFTAKVTACSPNGDGRYRVCLDQSGFFPGGGGQECDTGYIGGTRVICCELSNQEIVHFTDTPLTVGTEISCSIDREVRMSRMAAHSGEHIVSALMHRHFGFSNVGFHMGSEDVTADFDGAVGAETLAQIEAEANAVIRADLPITVTYPDSDALANMEYRSKLELTENVRIVSIGDLDRCACCAPHMPGTGMIGSIVFTEFQNWKGGIRIHMLCGAEAVAFCRSAIDRSDRLCRLLSSKPEKLTDSVIRLSEENLSLKRALSEMNETVNRAILSGLSGSGKPLVLRDEREDVTVLRSLATSAYPINGAPVCVIGSGGRFVIAGESLKSGFASLSALCPIKGGGSDTLICGSTTADISDDFIETFKQ